MKKIRKNVLTSILLVCFGLAITTVVFARAKFLSPPSPPGMPMITDLWATRCEITYTRPVHDGGFPINAYIVEYKDKRKKEWKLVASVRPDIYSFKVWDKKPGSEGQFRVFAQNDAGLSNPSKPSMLVKFQDR